MSKLLHCFALCFTLLLTLSFAYCQKVNNGKVSLITILSQLEKAYDVRFSYEDKTIAAITLYPLDQHLTFKDALEVLRKSTQLKFELISNRFIVVKPKHKNSLSIQLLDEIIVKNYLTKGLSKTIDGKISIASQKFGIIPGLIEPDILQTIQALPSVMSVDERISNLNVRGGTNDQNLILFEGIKMYQSGHFFGLISAFNPYLSEKVNVSKNGTSAKYGDGVSSIIAIENSDEISPKPKIGTGINLLSADAFAKIPLSNKTELQLSGRRSFTDILASPTYDAYFDRIFRDSELNINSSTNILQSQDEAFFFYDVNAKFIYDINPSSKLKVSLLNIFNRLDYNQAFTTSTSTLQESQSKLKQQSIGASATYVKNFKNKSFASAQFYLSSYNIDAISSDISNAQSIIQENDVMEFGARLDISKPISERLKLNSGYQFNEVGVTNLEDVNNPRFRRLIKEVVRTHGLYGELEYTSLSKNSFARLGLRGNYIEKFSKLLLEPRIAFNQRFLNHFRLEILGELKSQSIAQIIDLQQDFFGIEKRRWQLADNDQVPVIKSQQASLGITYDKNKLLISSEVFIKNVKGITARSQGFQNQFQLTNDTGEYFINGIDLLINKQFNNFSSWLSYTYSKNDSKFNNLNNGEVFPNVLDIRHNLNTSFTYDINQLKIGIGLNWHSGKPFTPPLEIQDTSNGTIEFEAPNSKRVSDYLRTDVSANYKFNLSQNTKAEIAVSIWNILDQENIINRFYVLDDSNTVVKIDNRSLRFTPNLSFRINF